MRLEFYFSCPKINFSCLKNLDLKGKLQTFVNHMAEYFLKHHDKVFLNIDIYT